MALMHYIEMDKMYEKKNLLTTFSSQMVDTWNYMYQPTRMLYVANCYLIVATPMDNIELLKQEVDIHPK